MTYIRIIVVMLFVIILTSCGATKDIIKVPQYQELIVSHPNETPSPTILNPTIHAFNINTLEKTLSASTDKSAVYYCMTQDEMSDMMLDEVAKLEYAQSETARANFYKNLIDNSNKRIRELNNKVSKSK